MRGHLIGADLSAGMLEAARPRVPAASLIAADASRLPLRDAIADLTLAMHMLYHVPDPVAAARELRRVTRPGATVVVGLNARDHMRELREAVQEAGLGYPGERVTLDDGEALLATVFTTVTRHDFPAQVRPPTPKPRRGLHPLHVRDQVTRGSRGPGFRHHQPPVPERARQLLHNHHARGLPSLPVVVRLPGTPTARV